MREFDLYEPMVNWLKQYLEGKYKNCEIFVEDTHSQRLDRALHKYGIINDLATGVDIQIDVLGIVRKNESYKLFFIEAKITKLTLRDLGQLWAYCKLIDPEEAFLLTSESFGSLNKILRTFGREDLLDFGNGKKVKKMKVGIWNVARNNIDYMTLIPQ